MVGGKGGTKKVGTSDEQPAAIVTARVAWRVTFAADKDSQSPERVAVYHPCASATPSAGSPLAADRPIRLLPHASVGNHGSEQARIPFGDIWCQFVSFGPDVHTRSGISLLRVWHAGTGWRFIDARTENEARSFYVARLRRRMGVAAVREFARHRLRRVSAVCALRRSASGSGSGRAAHAAGGVA